MTQDSLASRVAIQLVNRPQAIWLAVDMRAYDNVVQDMAGLGIHGLVSVPSQHPGKHTTVAQNCPVMLLRMVQVRNLKDDG